VIPLVVSTRSPIQAMQVMLSALFAYVLHASQQQTKA
jgi:hypothetical protein